MADFANDPNNRTMTQIWAWLDEHDCVMLREGIVRMKPRGAEILYALAWLDKDTAQRAMDDRDARDWAEKNDIPGLPKL